MSLYDCLAITWHGPGPFTRPPSYRGQQITATLRGCLPAFARQWESQGAAIESWWAAETKVAGPWQEKFADPSPRQLCDTFSSVTSFPILSLDLFFLLSWEIWSNQKITSISSYCHASLSTSIFTHKPWCPSVITNCSCSYAQSLYLYTTSCLLWSNQRQSSSISPFHLHHFLALSWIIPIHFQTHFVTPTLRKRKKKKILRTLIPSSSFSPILLLICRKFLKTVVYILSCLSSHFSQICSNQDLTLLTPQNLFVQIPSAFLIAKSNGSFQPYLPDLQHVTQWITPSLLSAFAESFSKSSRGIFDCSDLGYLFLSGPGSASPELHKPKKIIMGKMIPQRRNILSRQRSTSMTMIKI